MYSVLSGLGRQLFFPKGILTQTAEAREKADRYNATIGIARQGGHAMNLPVIMDMVPGLSSDEALDYAPSTGNAALRRRWLDDMFVKNPSLAGKEVSLPVVTSGVTHGLTVAGEMFVDPGDAVLVTNKFWGNYNMVFGVRRGADVRQFPLFVDGGASFDVGGMAAALGAALDEKGKALVLLNFPNNPTGYSIRRAEAGEEAAVEAYASAGRFLGIALGMLINLLNPGMILLGGGVMTSGELLLRPAIDEARRRSYKASFACCPIERASLGNDAGTIGAAAWAKNNL